MHDDLQLQDWLSQATGLQPGWQIEQIDTLPESSDTVWRVFLDWPDVDPPGPKSLIVKTHAAGTTRRQFAEGFGMVAREAAFYAHLAPAMAVPAAKCLHLDPSIPLLVLEDLGKFRTGDQQAGYTAEELESATDALFRFHAAFMGQAEDDGPFAALPRPDAELGLEQLKGPLQQTLAMAQHHPDLTLTPDMLKQLGEIAADPAPMAKLMCSGPMTLVHGDYRFANLLFDHEDQLKAVIDWQLLARGNPMIDVAYLLAQGGDFEIMAPHWLQLRQRYQTLYAKHGADPDLVESHFRAAAAWGLVIPLLALAVEAAEPTDLAPIITACLNRGALALAELETL